MTMSPWLDLEKLATQIAARLAKLEAVKLRIWADDTMVYPVKLVGDADSVRELALWGLSHYPEAVKLDIAAVWASPEGARVKPLVTIRGLSKAGSPSPEAATVSRGTPMGGGVSHVP